MINDKVTKEVIVWANQKYGLNTPGLDGVVITQFDSTEHKFLSNFYLHPVVYDGIGYPTSEHAYQAAKSTDLDEQLAIANEPDPAKAKKMGRAVKY